MLVMGYNNTANSAAAASVNANRATSTTTTSNNNNNNNANKINNKKNLKRNLKFNLNDNNTLIVNSIQLEARKMNNNSNNNTYNRLQSNPSNASDSSDVDYISDEKLREQLSQAEASANHHAQHVLKCQLCELKKKINIINGLNTSHDDYVEVYEPHNSEECQNDSDEYNDSAYIDSLINENIIRNLQHDLPLYKYDFYNCQYNTKYESIYTASSNTINNNSNNGKDLVINATSLTKIHSNNELLRNKLNSKSNSNNNHISPVSTSSSSSSFSTNAVVTGHDSNLSSYINTNGKNAVPIIFKPTTTTIPSNVTSSIAKPKTASSNTKRPQLFKGYWRLSESKDEFNKKFKFMHQQQQKLKHQQHKVASSLPFLLAPKATTKKPTTPSLCASSTSFASTTNVNSFIANNSNTSNNTNNSTNNINNRLIKAPLRGLLDEGSDKHEPFNFQACLISEKFSNRLSKLNHSFNNNQKITSKILHENSQNSMRIKRSKTNVAHINTANFINAVNNANLMLARESSLLLNTNINDYLRIKSAYK